MLQGEHVPSCSRFASEDGEFEHFRGGKKRVILVRGRNFDPVVCASRFA